MNPKREFNYDEEAIIALGKSYLSPSFINPYILEFPLNQRYQKLWVFSDDVTSSLHEIVNEVNKSAELANTSHDLLSDPDWSIDFDAPEALVRVIVAYQVALKKVDEFADFTDGAKGELARALDAYYFTLFFHLFSSSQLTEGALGMMDYQGELEPKFQVTGGRGGISVIEHFSRDLNLGKKVHIYQSIDTLSGVAQIIEAIGGGNDWDNSFDWLSRALYFFHVKEVVKLAEMAKIEFREFGMLLAVTNENGRKRTRDSLNRAFSDKPFRRNSPYSLNQVVHMGIIWKAAIQGLDLNFNYNPQRFSIGRLAGLVDDSTSRKAPNLCEKSFSFE